MQRDVTNPTPARDRRPSWRTTRDRLRSIVLSLLAGAGLTTGMMATHVPAASAAPGTVREAVIVGDWADPELVADPVSGRFHSFATNFTVFGTTVNVPVRSSPDLGDWSTFHGDALPDLPDWATAGFTWAPGVAHIADQWVLYFTARHTASGRQCIGAATADDPTGAFVPSSSEPLICQLSLGGSIDASPFQDPATGAWGLAWKSDENAPGAPQRPRLWSQGLSDDGLALVGDATVLLAYDETSTAEAPLIENPDMVHAGGRWWLFYSANWWDSADYRHHVATCTGPAGPCTRVGTAAQPWLGQQTTGVPGPGGATIFDAGGQRWMTAFHGWIDAVGYDAGGARAMHLEPITFPHDDQLPEIRPDLDRTVRTEPARQPDSSRAIPLLTDERLPDHFDDPRRRYPVCVSPTSRPHWLR